jgi:phenylalanyl-tRNA synthetase alpha chain
MPAPEISSLLEGLHPLEVRVLRALGVAPSASEVALREASGLAASQLSMALGWLLTKGAVRVENERVTRRAALAEAGKRYAADFLPEIRILKWLSEGQRVTVGDLRANRGLEPDEVSGAVGTLKGLGAIRVVEGGVLESVPDVELGDLLTLQREIEWLESAGSRVMSEPPTPSDRLVEQHFTKRGKAKGIFRIDEDKERTFALTEVGSALAHAVCERGLGLAEEISQLTPDLLKDGAWRGKAVRKYNIGLRPARVFGGRKHPYRAFLDEVKLRLVSMGFEEMRGSLVENEFWNMDALFMPQFHPAREIHDVYFVREPRESRPIPEPFATNVARAHENGKGAGSVGWRYPFDPVRARRLVLRSQGTAVSARTMAAGPKIPGKYFSIARCFRYDQVDATHAPDFFQVEGIVLGADITFRTLLGLLRLFAVEVARAPDVKFLPAYFPYTEPSVELHAKHPQLGWMELGGAGLFRPEVTRPLGVNVPVIAWGLGLDRMAMTALGLSDIRDLFTPDLEQLRVHRATVSL